jgi:hypothetical protein
LPPGTASKQVTHFADDNSVDEGKQIRVFGEINTHTQYRKQNNNNNNNDCEQVNYRMEQVSVLCGMFTRRMFAVTIVNDANLIYMMNICAVDM